jgi:aryl-alcohol dehydrogenase-like predicted oxidoreductase
MIGPLQVSAVGLGAMGFSHGYGPGVSDDEAIGLLRKAFDLGCTFYDTAEGYGAGDNERLVGRLVLGRGTLALFSSLITASKRGSSNRALTCEPSGG